MFSLAYSEIFWETLEKIVEAHGDLVTNVPVAFVRNHADAYASAIRESGAELDRYVTFIDRTKIKCARPGGADSYKRYLYSGHKRCHCLTYQTLTASDGLILHLFGPVEGRKPDIVIYTRFGLEHVLPDSRSLKKRAVIHLL